ncbi:MAG: sulfatase-like hydrolase/transferase [Hydrogenophaga sp.]|nr:sulfatase-like hydrolase/transferase [Hydrogenophaga sp.]
MSRLPASLPAPTFALPPAARALAHEGRAAARTLGPLLPLVLGMWLVLLVSRLGLMAWLAPRVSAQGAWAETLLQGLRFDGVMLGFVWCLPATLWPLAALAPRLQPLAWRGLRAVALAAFAALLFLEWATPAFIAEYDNRPNYLFVEYLRYVREVGGTVLAERPLALLAALIAIPGLTWLYARTTRTRTAWPRLHPLTALLLSVLLFCGTALAARGTLGHRAANPALAATTSDGLVNQLPLSSAYALLYALYQARRSEEGGIVYGSLPREDVLRTVIAGTGQDPASFDDPRRPSQHLQANVPALAKPHNLVIVLEESLGAEFVGRLGGVPVTPNLERLAAQGLWFDRLYATGTRSVRGIEAVVAGFPPTSAPSTVKLAKSQQGFFTLASFLKGKGYTSTFFYGGESHFDNMRSYFMGNGFDHVVDQNHFGPDVFRGTWGVADGPLLDAAHRAFSQARAPFFGLVFTSSNHAPFEFPDGEIALHEQPKGTVLNAVKYADHALGRFFEQAQKAPYWKDTVFLVVADHNSRVYGDALVPVKRFHIPGLVLGGPVTPGVIEQTASQIDLGPTLISLLGLQGRHPMIGRDLSQPAVRALPGRAVMQFDKAQAYMEDDQVVVLRPDLPPALLLHDPATGQTLPGGEPPPALVHKAVAQALFTPMAYRERWHTDAAP